jgi:MFS family permease
MYQLMLTIGILVAFVTNAATESKRTGWRTSLGLSCLLSSTLSIGMFFFPESPSWLLKHATEGETRAALTRLYKGYPHIVDREVVALKKATAEAAKQPEGSWSEVFKPEMRRRLIIGWGTQLHQQLTGINVIMMYSVIIFGSANIPQFTGTIVVGLVNVASTFIAMKFIDKKGRKWLLLVGALVQALCFVLAAITISASGLIKPIEAWYGACFSTEFPTERNDIGSHACSRSYRFTL